MSNDLEKPSLQRERTDDSLRLEREQVDRALWSSHTQAEVEAGQDVELARERSDASLRAARERVDNDERQANAAARMGAAEMLAEQRRLQDQVLQHARDTADTVLNLAREKADQLVEQASQQATCPSPVTIEARLAEDAIRDSGRARADEQLQREREESRRALAKLLPLEREKTNRYLLTERAGSDAALSTRDDFLAMVSHDLRSLLGGIVMGVEVLVHNAKQGESARQVVANAGNIQHYAARMNRLIGDLVDVVSIDAGKLSMVSAVGDANALLADAVAPFESSAVERGITLCLEPTEHPPQASFDRDRLLQVLANLIANALKFTPRGGRISLRVDSCDSELCFSVRDTGPGIQTPMLDTIFERFWQAGENDSRGLGLGLHISKRIVEAHGGRIWAQSHPGHGLTVWFTLPALERAPST